MKSVQQSALWAVLATFLFAGWQQITVARNFGGNWTALFCTGARQPVPPSLRAGTYLVPNPFGYDGQMYRYVAHDPFLIGEAHKYLDSPALRARRILVPGSAWLLALGKQDWIDRSYILLFFVSCFGGTYWAAAYLAASRNPQAWSLLFLAVPATLIGTDRLVIDMPACALAVGLVRYTQAANRPMLFVLLVLSCLCRETGLIFAAAFVASAAIQRCWSSALLFSASFLPALAWYRYVAAMTEKAEVLVWLGNLSRIGPLQMLLHPVQYPFIQPLATVAQWLDRAAISGLLLAFALAISFGLERWKEPLHLAALLFAASALATLDPRFWEDVYGYARPYSPLVAIVAMRGALVSDLRWLWLLPAALLDGRILFQLSPQILGILGFHVRT